MNIRLWDKEKKEFVSQKDAEKYVDKNKVMQDSFFGLTLAFTFEVVLSTGFYDQVKFDQIDIEEREAWLASGRVEGDWLGHELYIGDIIKNGLAYLYVIKYDKQAGKYFQERVGKSIERMDLRFNDKTRIGNIYENYDIINSAMVQK